MIKFKINYHASLLCKGVWFLIAFFASAKAHAITAEEAYQAGNCAQAIALYEDILKSSASTAEQKNTAEFRTAYCHYTLGESELAERHFQKYLKVFPKDEEARLRYAESLFQQGKWTRVIQNSAQTRGSWSKNEIELLTGRSYLEMKEPEIAISHFSQVQAQGQLQSQTQYWWAVAEYQRGNKIVAKSHFEKATQNQQAPEWIRSYANDWMRQIKRDLRLTQGSITLGYFYDGNLSYTSTQNVNSLTGQPQVYSPNPSSYITDHGILIGGKFYGTLKESFPWSLTYSLDTSLPYYSNNPSYNNETVGAGLALNYTKSSKLKYGFDVHYLDSRYKYQYYQDFLTLTPSLTWSPSPKWNIYVSAPYTLYLLTRNLSLVSPSVSVKFQAYGPLTLSAGVNFTQASGTAATYANANPSYVSTGTMFSNYSNLGSYLGLGLQLPKGFYWSAQAGIYKTNYKAESVPLTVGQTASAPRSDQLISYSTDLYYELINDKLSFDLSYSHYNNSSSGFQGIAYSTTMSTYNYQRPYFLFTTTLSL